MKNKWGEFSGIDKVRLKYFQWLQMRVAKGYCETDMPNNRGGYKQFLTEIGEIPAGMLKPTVGRKNHKLGYTKGNFAWQDWIENCKENDKELISENSKKVSRRLWDDPDWSAKQREILSNSTKCAKQSVLMKGNSYASGKRTEQQKQNMKDGRARARASK